MVFPLALNYGVRYLLQLLVASCVLASGRREMGSFSPEQLCVYATSKLVPHNIQGWIRFLLGQQQRRQGRIVSAPNSSQSLAMELLPLSQPRAETCPQAPLRAAEHLLVLGGASVTAAGGATRPFRGLAASWDLVLGQDLMAVQAATAGQTEALKGGDASFATTPAARFPLSLQGARPKQREQNRDQKAGRTGRRSRKREGGEGPGRYPLSYQNLDRAQLHHRVQELAWVPQVERDSEPSCAPERVGDTERDTERVEVMGSWKSRNGRLHLVDILTAGPRGTWSSELQSQVIWESVQDANGNFDLAKLEEAIAEVHEDLAQLPGCRKGGSRKEELAADFYHFHYYPDKSTLQLTLEQLQVQRKMVLWGVAPHAWHHEQGCRQAAGRRGLGPHPRPRLCSRCGSPLSLANERQREGLQGTPTGHTWVAALRRCCCFYSCSQGEENEEEEEEEEEEGGRD